MPEEDTGRSLFGLRSRTFALLSAMFPPLELHALIGVRSFLCFVFVIIVDSLKLGVENINQGGLFLLPFDPPLPPFVLCIILLPSLVSSIG